MSKLIISNLNKRYENGVQAIDNISLNIGNGMFGLLGPNGAGKSSLMRTIATLQSPDSGEISFGNINVLNEQLNFRKILGYLPQDFGVYPKISAEKLLNYFALLKGISSKKDRNIITDYVLELTNLYNDRKKNVDTYSGGMKQRFGIAQLLLNNPKLIIVDEPTAGLDPAERHRFLNILREISTENTIIFSTHIVDDVKDLCKEMAILASGKILKKMTPNDARKELDGKIWSMKIPGKQLEQFANNYRVLSSSFNDDNTMTVRVYNEVRPGENFTPTVTDLDDVYFLTLQNSHKN